MEREARAALCNRQIVSGRRKEKSPPRCSVEVEERVLRSRRLSGGLVFADCIQNGLTNVIEFPSLRSSGCCGDWVIFSVLGKP